MTSVSGSAEDTPVLAEFPSEIPQDHEDILAATKRLRALSGADLLETLPEPAYDRMTRLATRILGAPVSLMSLVSPEQQFFKSAYGLPDDLKDTRATPLSHSMCQYVVTQNQGLAVHDARTHPLLKHNGAIEDLGVIAYLGEPIRSPNGQVLGSFCAIDDKPHLWTAEDQAILRDLADMIESEMRLRHTVNRNDLLLKEMSHRVKNMFTLTGSLVRQSFRQARDKEHLVEGLLGRLMALSSSHELALGDPDALAESQAMLGDLIEVAVAPHRHSGDAPIVVEGPSLSLYPSAITYVALTLHELATNAAKYGALSDNGGTLSVAWETTEKGARLIWDERTEIANPNNARGFGSEMLDNAVMFGLGGEIDRSITFAGIRYVIDLPKDALAR